VQEVKEVEDRNFPLRASSCGAHIPSIPSPPLLPQFPLLPFGEMEEAKDVEDRNYVQ
jgi:hypothetical protein